MPKKESNYVQVLRLYLSKRDDHGTGIENGLTVPDISQKFHWKKGEYTTNSVIDYLTPNFAFLHEDNLTLPLNHDKFVLNHHT